MSGTDQWYDAIVVGGGPAGSTCASALAERGLTVLVLERARFPRFHIGESMLTYSQPLFERLGIVDAMRAVGFPVKTGAEFSEPGGRYARVDFTDQGDGRAPTTYQVERAILDEVLLERAARVGARVLQEARVNQVDVVDGRVVGVTYTHDGRSRSARARCVIDASGRAGLITKGLLRSRRSADRLRMVAVFRHYEGVDEATNPGVEGDIQIGSHENGWIWGIPIGPGKLSVGAVTRPEVLKRATSQADLHADHVSRAPRIHQRIAGLDRYTDLRVESDFSYYSEQVAGPGFFVVGDAGCFVDPIFSAGVYLALTSGQRAADMVAAVLDGTLPEAEAVDRYTRFYKTGYDTYFRLIYAFYDHGFKLGRFLKSTGAQVAPVWVARLFGGDFWSTKNPLGRHLRAVPEYRTFGPYEPLYGCPVYPELEAREREDMRLDGGLAPTG